MDDLSSFIHQQRNLIHEEKKKFGLIDSRYPQQKLHSHLVGNPSATATPVRCHPLGQDRKKSVKATEDIVSKCEAPLNILKVKKMVRYGEYSPLNPNCRVTGKLLLGIGEYEERRRLMEEQRKKQYKEQVQSYLKDKHSWNKNIINNNSQKCDSKFVDKSVQVEPLSVDFEQYYDSGRTNCVDECIQVTEELHNTNVLSSEPVKVKNTQYDIPQLCKTNRMESNFLNDDENVPVHENLFLSLSDCNNPEPVELSLLSPRERKILEFHGSGRYSPSFYQKRSSVADGVPGRETTESERIAEKLAQSKLKKTTYQEELRKQIEEKKRIETKLQEKRKKEEEAIMKRIEQQQQKMRLEFEKEHLQLQEKLARRQHLSDARNNKLEIGNELNRRVESELGSTANYDHNNSSISECSEKNSTNGNNELLSRAVELDNKLSSEIPSKAATDSQDLLKNNCDKNLNDLSFLKCPVDMDGNDNAEYRRQANTAPFINSTTYCDNHLVKSNNSNSESKLNNVRIAGITKNAHTKEECCGIIPSNESSCLMADTNRIPESLIPHKKRPVPTPRRKLSSVGGESRENSDLAKIHKQTSSCIITNQNLDDSLPIPVFADNDVDVHLNRAAILRCDAQQNKAVSEAMTRTEAKWKVPAVQKNVVQARPDCREPHRGRILTQLGAFRRQMQLDQLHIEEMLKKKTVYN